MKSERERNEVERRWTKEGRGKKEVGKILNRERGKIKGTWKRDLKIGVERKEKGGWVDRG